MAKSCPNKNTKEYMLLASQIGDALAVYTWQYYGEKYPHNLMSTLSLKREIKIPNSVTEKGKMYIQRRIKAYNDLHNNSHRVEFHRYGQADSYTIDFIPNYLPKKSLRKQQEVFKNAEIIEQNPIKHVDIKDGNQFISESGNVYNTYEDAYEDIQESTAQIASPVNNLTQGVLFQSNEELDQIKQEAISNGTFMKAPNGNPTNLNEKQWLQVRTKEFKNWFGDWEIDMSNDAKEISQLKKDVNFHIDRIEDAKYQLRRLADGTIGHKREAHKKNIEQLFDSIGKDRYKVDKFLQELEEEFNIIGVTDSDKLLDSISESISAIKEGNELISNIRKVSEELRQDKLALRKLRGEDISASKVVDENGEPLVVYHGTNSEINEFKKINDNGVDVLGEGYYFDSSIVSAKSHAYFKNGDVIISAFLNIRELTSNNFQEMNNQFVTTGYEQKENTGKHFIYKVENSNQIKSAENNTGRFDTNNPNILFQADAWHGSPHKIDRFSTDYIGTGEGNQAFGWGLYFTDLEDIARNYANELSVLSTENLLNNEGEEILRHAVINGITNESKENILDSYYKKHPIYKPLNEKEEREIYGEDYQDMVSYRKLQEDILIKRKNEKFNTGRNLYKVSLHKDKTPDQYTWLEWDKRDKSPDLLKKLNSALLYLQYKNNIQEKDYYSEPMIAINTGQSIYERISEILGSDKEASLFLLENGIDGIKYPAESISRGATSDNARGFNYVVFDENAIQIEEHIQFQGASEKAKGAYDNVNKIIFALTDPNISTPIHELAHLWEQFLTPEERKAVLEWTGDIEWDRGTSEKFAIGFERYLAEGVAPNKRTEGLFEKFSNWLKEIYNNIAEMLGKPLSPKMKEIYGTILNAKAKPSENIKVMVNGKERTVLQAQVVTYDTEFGQNQYIKEDDGSVTQIDKSDDSTRKIKTNSNEKEGDISSDRIRSKYEKLIREYEQAANRQNWTLDKNSPLHNYHNDKNNSNKDAKSKKIIEGLFNVLQEGRGVLGKLIESIEREKGSELNFKGVVDTEAPLAWFSTEDKSIYINAGYDFSSLLDGYDNDIQRSAILEMIISEELIHALDDVIISNQERLAAWEELSDETKLKIKQYYHGSSYEKYDTSPDILMREFLRAKIQNDLFGISSEIAKIPLQGKKTQSLVYKIYNYLLSFFKDNTSPLSDVLINRLNTAIEKSEAPIIEQIGDFTVMQGEATDGSGRTGWVLKDENGDFVTNTRNKQVVFDSKKQAIYEADKRTKQNKKKANNNQDVYLNEGSTDVYNDAATDIIEEDETFTEAQRTGLVYDLQNSAGEIAASVIEYMENGESFIIDVNTRNILKAKTLKEAIKEYREAYENREVASSTKKDDILSIKIGDIFIIPIGKGKNKAIVPVKVTGITNGVYEVEDRFGLVKTTRAEKTLRKYSEGTEAEFKAFTTDQYPSYPIPKYSQGNVVNTKNSTGVEIAEVKITAGETDGTFVLEYISTTGQVIPEGYITEVSTEEVPFVKETEKISDGENNRKIAERIAQSFQKIFPSIKLYIGENPLLEGRPARFYEGTVLLNPDHPAFKAKAATIHEFLHPLVAALRETNTKLYNSLIEELRTKRPNINENNDEAAVIYLTEKFETAFNEDGTINREEVEKRSLLDEVMQWLSNLIDFLLGRKFSSPSEFVKRANKFSPKFKFINELKGDVEVTEKDGTYTIKIPSTLNGRKEEIPSLTIEAMKAHIGVVKVEGRADASKDPSLLQEFTNVVNNAYYRKGTSVSELNPKMKMDDVATFFLKQMTSDTATTYLMTQEEQKAYSSVVGNFTVAGDRATQYKKTFLNKIKHLEDVVLNRSDAHLLTSLYKDLQYATHEFKEDAEFMIEYVQIASDKIGDAYRQYTDILRRLSETNNSVDKEELRAINKKLYGIRSLVGFYDNYQNLIGIVEEDLKNPTDKERKRDWLERNRQLSMIRQGLQEVTINTTVNWFSDYINEHNKLMTQKGYTNPKYLMSHEKMYRILKWGDQTDSWFVSAWLGANITSRDPVNAMFASIMGDEISYAQYETESTASQFHSSFLSFAKRIGISPTNTKAMNEYFVKNYMRDIDVTFHKYDDAGKLIGTEKKKKKALHQKYFYDKYYNELEAEKEKYKNPKSPVEALLFDRALDEWKKKRIEYDAKGNPIFDENDNPLLKDIYLNPEYKKLQDSDPFFKYLEQIYHASNNKYGKQKLQFGLIPQKFSSSFMEKMKKEISDIKAAPKTKEKLKIVKEALVRSFRHPNEEAFKTNLDGTQHQEIASTLNNIKEEANISYELNATIIDFMVEANRYKVLKDNEYAIHSLAILSGEKNKIGLNARVLAQEDFAKKIKSKDDFDNLIKERDELLEKKVLGEDVDEDKLSKIQNVIDKGYKPRTIFDKIGKVLKPAESNYNNDSLLDQINNIFYGYKSDDVDIFGLSGKKLADKLSTYTSIVNMAFNVIAGASNVSIGNVQMLVEANSGTYYNKKDFAKATADYIKNIPNYLGDIKNPIKSKDTQLSFMFDAIQGEIEDGFGNRVSGNLAKKFFNIGTLFILSRAGEHQIQLTNMKAMMLGRKVKLADGQEIPLYDAYVADANGRYQLRKDVVNFSEKELKAFMRELHSVNRMLNGNYSEMHKNKIQYQWWGQLAMKFRKYLYDAFRARWSSERVDYERNNVEVGYIRYTLLTALPEYLRRLQGKIKKRKLLAHEERAVKKGIMEIGIYVGITILAYALFGGGDDDKVDLSDGQKFALLMLLRLRGDLGMYTIDAPSEANRQMRSPTMSLQFISNVLKTAEQLRNPFETYDKEYGKYEKGDSKFLAKASKLLPLGQMRDIFNGDFSHRVDDHLGYISIINRNIEGVKPRESTN